MSRTVSEAAVRAMFDQETTEAFLVKLEIDHSTWGTPYRFINDRADHTDGSSVEWIGYPFKIRLPDDRDDEAPIAELSIDNVDRQIVQAVREIQSPPSITLWVVLGSDIDDVVAGPYEFSLNSVKWDSLVVSGSLEYEPILNIRYPQDRFTYLTTPGLFKT